MVPCQDTQFNAKVTQRMSQLGNTLKCTQNEAAYAIAASDKSPQHKSKSGQLRSVTILLLLLIALPDGIIAHLGNSTLESCHPCV